MVRLPPLNLLNCAGNPTSTELLGDASVKTKCLPRIDECKAKTAAILTSQD